MALRGTASIVLTTSGTSIGPLSVSGIGIQNGDVVILYAEGGTGAAGDAFTFPSGFTAISGLSINNMNASASNAIAMKVANNEPSSYTVTVNNSNYSLLICRAYSGRSGVVTAASNTVSTSTGHNAGAPATYTLSLTGITAAANDDIVSFMGFPNNNASVAGDTYTINPDPTGFANNINAYDTSTAYSMVSLSCDSVNSAGGATGSIAYGVAYTSSGSQFPGYYSGYVFSLAKASASTAVTFVRRIGGRHWP